MINLNPPITDRFLRQRDLVSTEKLANTPVTIIGVGAIGRQVAMQLAALGVMQLQLVDFDTVEAHNVTNQGYRERDVGQSKVDSTAAAITEVDASISADCVADRFRIRQSTADVVFCCVDSIASRSAIWKHLETRTNFWADGRMMGEVMRILTASDSESRAGIQPNAFLAVRGPEGLLYVT